MKAKLLTINTMKHNNYMKPKGAISLSTDKYLLSLFRKYNHMRYNKGAIPAFANNTMRRINEWLHPSRYSMRTNIKLAIYAGNSYCWHNSSYKVIIHKDDLYIKHSSGHMVYAEDAAMKDIKQINHS